MSFGVKASNSDGSNVTTIDKYKLEIKNASGVVVSTQTGVGALPSILYFNGIVNGAWMVDGNYNSVLTVTRTILDVTGDTVVSSPIIAKSNVLASEKVIIMSPAANTTQIRGGFNISGQAPANWKVDVCISKVATDPDNCVSSTVNDTYKLSGTASAMGYYTIIAEIPDTSTKDYFITAKANNGAGVKTLLSDTVKTTVDLKPNILSIDMNGSLDGVNSDADIQALIAGTKSIDDVRGLVIKIRVTQNTEAVDINFGQYANVNTDVPSIDYLNQRAGTINASADGRGNYIPNQADILRGTTYTSYTQVKDNSFYQNKCQQVECVWQYTIPYPRLTAGGDYELKFTSYKGRDVSGNLLSTVDTRGFAVNGQLPMNVDLMLVVKGTVTYGTNAMLAKYINSVYYTNNLQNTVVIGGEATKAYTVNVLNSANAVVISQATGTNSNGYATSTLNLPIGTPEGDYRIQVLGNTIGTLRYDKTPPSLTMVKTSDITTYDSQAIPNVFPFVKSGANIKYEYLFSEATDENYMVSANGYVSYATSNGTNYVNNLILTGAANGRYSPIIYTRDYAGNMVDFGNDLNTINSIKAIVPAIVNAKIAQSSVITPQAVNYDPSQATTFNNLRNANKDFSVIVDGVNPDIAGSFDKSGWYDNDGAMSDGISPEVDRLKTISVADCQTNKTCSFVIRGNTVTLKVKGEKYARGVFEYGLNSVPNSKQYVNPTSTNCTAGTDVISNGVVVKQGSLCDLTYTVTLNSDGSQYDTGEAKNYYQIDFYLVDNSGNIPSPVNNTYKTEIVVLYQDKTANSNVLGMIKSPDNTPLLGDPNSNDPTKRQITKSSEVSLILAGENKSENEIEVLKNGVVQNLGNNITILNDQNQQITTNTRRVIKNGNKTDNKGNIIGNVFAQNCVSVGCSITSTIDYTSASTNISLPSDGVYTINYRQIDTAGNRSAWKTLTIEKDTTPPVMPSVSIIKTDRLASLTVSGETGTIIDITVNGKTQRLSGNKQDIYLACGTRYDISATLTDRAGNVSPKYTTYFITDQCPVVSSQTISTGNATLDSSGNLLAMADTNPSDTGQKIKRELFKLVLYSDNGFMKCTQDILVNAYSWTNITTDFAGFTEDALKTKIKESCNFAQLEMISVDDSKLLDTALTEVVKNAKLLDRWNAYGDAIYGFSYEMSTAFSCMPGVIGLGEFIWQKKLCSETAKKKWQDWAPMVVNIMFTSVCSVGTALVGTLLCAAGGVALYGVVKGWIGYAETGKIDFGSLGIELATMAVFELGSILFIEFVAVPVLVGVATYIGIVGRKFLVPVLENMNFGNMMKLDVEMMLTNLRKTTQIVKTAIVGGEEFVTLPSGRLASKAITPNILASNIDEQAARYLGKTFKIELDGIIKEITIPSDFKYVMARDGQGIVFYDASKYTADVALTQSRGIYRIANPQFGTFPNPNGKFRYYSEGTVGGTNGQPLDINGKIGSENSTHFNLLSY